MQECFFYYDFKRQQLQYVMVQTLISPKDTNENHAKQTQCHNPRENYRKVI